MTTPLHRDPYAAAWTEPCPEHGCYAPVDRPCIRRASRFHATKGDDRINPHPARVRAARVGSAVGGELS